MAKKKVVLTNQSFRSAGGLESFPDLQMVGIVATTTYNQHNSFEALINRAHEELKEQARKMNCSHIFGVEYLDHVEVHKHASYGPDYKVVGTAYCSRTKKR